MNTFDWKIFLKQESQKAIADYRETKSNEQVVLQRFLSDKRTGLVRIVLSNNSKDFVDKLRLRYTIPLADSFHLSFANHIHCLNPAQSSPCCVE